MPSPRKGFSRYKRKGPESALYTAQLELRDIRYWWVNRVRDEASVRAFREARDRAVNVLDLAIEALQLTRKMMAEQPHAVDYDLRLGRYVKLTSQRRERRTVRYTEGKALWKATRARRASEKEARQVLLSEPPAGEVTN